MFLSAELGAALDRIGQRAADVRRAFVSGAFPQNDDVATGNSTSDFTLDPLSVALPQDVFAVTRDAAGRTVYTRDASFHLDGASLRTADGKPVLGLTPGGDRLTALRVDAVDAALGRARDVRLESDGALAYTRDAIDARTGRRQSQRVVAGRLAIARFPAATALRTADGVTYEAPEGVVAFTGVPGENGLPRLTPMQRQRSGVNLDESLARLKAAYVAFDAVAAAETARGKLGKAAMDLVK